MLLLSGRRMMPFLTEPGGQGRGQPRSACPLCSAGSVLCGAGGDEGNEFVFNCTDETLPDHPCLISSRTHAAWHRCPARCHRHTRFPTAKSSVLPCGEASPPHTLEPDGRGCAALKNESGVQVQP